MDNSLRGADCCQPQSYNSPRKLESPVNLLRLTQRVPGKRWYNAFNRVGFEYGPAFQPLTEIRTNGKDHEAAANVNVATESGVMDGESRYTLHPSTIDACLQLIIISINAGLHTEMACGVLPPADGRGQCVVSQRSSRVKRSCSRIN